MASPFLLDVNVLIALFDQAHIHHSNAHEWFAEVGRSDWRTCPITENGFLRILSHPAYPNSPVPILDLAERLEEFKASLGTHQFWSNDYSFSGWISERKVSIGSTQSTDAYLLNLCLRNNGVLATFDRRITPAIVGETLDSIVEYLPV